MHECLPHCFFCSHRCWCGCSRDDHDTFWDANHLNRRNGRSTGATGRQALPVRQANVVKTKAKAKSYTHPIGHASRYMKKRAKRQSLGQSSRCLPLAQWHAPRTPTRRRSQTEPTNQRGVHGRCILQKQPTATTRRVAHRYRAEAVHTHTHCRLCLHAVRKMVMAHEMMKWVARSVHTHTD